MSNPLRAAVGRRLHQIIDRRIAEKASAIRRAALFEYQVYGPPERLHLDASAKVNDALFNTVSGSISVAAGAFFGHGVAVLTGTHDITVRGPARQVAIPQAGHDVSIGPGAWVSSRATVIGPCTIGADAVVCAGSVVTGDVPPAAVVAGAPARVIRTLDGGIPAAEDIETDVGRLYLHAHDEVLTPDITAAGGMDDVDLRLLRELVPPGATVIDVGANIGYATLVAARAAGPEGRVIAVEPHPENLLLLRANLARNEVANVEVVGAAAWSESGEVALAECRTNTGDHRVGTRMAGRRELRVPAVRLDDVVGPDRDVAVVKLDTQATEHLALRGARELLSRCRPRLLAEFWPQGLRERGEDPLSVLAYYDGLAYDRRVLEEPGLDSAPDAELVERVHARPAPFGGFVTLRLDPRPV